MKKVLKFLEIVGIIVIVYTSFGKNVCLAADTIIDDLNIYTNNIDKGNNTKFNSMVGNLIGVINVVGSIVAVSVIVIVGIKYMLSSIDGKAEYKKTAMYYVLGAILLFAGTNIVQVIYNVIQEV